MRKRMGGFARRLAGAFLAASLLTVTARLARAQEAETPESMAARKAALVIEGEGVVNLKPTGYSFTIEYFVENKGGKKAVLAEFDQRREQLRTQMEQGGLPGVTFSDARPELAMRLGDSYHTSGIDAEVWDRPAAVVRAKGMMFARVDTTEKAERLLTLLRATGVSGSAQIFPLTEDYARYRLTALKAAVANVKQRVEMLSEAARPKEFDLIFIREGEYSVAPYQFYASLTDKGPLPRFTESVPATAHLTMYYSLRPATVATAAPKPSSPKPLPKTTVKPVAKPATRP
jgi:uncharacterized protein YggE